MPRVGNAGAEERRLEEARVVVPHDLGGRDRREVRGALMLAASAERLAEAEQDERAGEESAEDAEEEESGLAGFGANPPGHLGTSHRSASPETARPSSPRVSRPPRASWAPIRDSGR